MSSIIASLNLLFLATLIVGCKSTQQKSLREVIPIYALASQAREIATGQFGAAPIALLSEDEIDLIGSQPCATTVMQVKSHTGQQGWTPFNSLPQRLQNLFSCKSDTPPPLHKL